MNTLVEEKPKCIVKNGWQYLSAALNQSQSYTIEEGTDIKGKRSSRNRICACQDQTWLYRSNKSLLCWMPPSIY